MSIAKYYGYKWWLVRIPRRTNSTILLVVRFGSDFDQVLVGNTVTKVDRLDALYFLSFMKYKQVAF